MIRLIFIVLFLFLIMHLFSGIEFGGSNLMMPESMMGLGFTLLAAYLIGRMLTGFQLPKITGYIIAGIIVGPYFTNLLTKPVVQNLQLIDNIALGLIALTAGGEFRYRDMRGQMTTVVSTILWKILLIFIGFLGFFFLFGHQFNFLQGKPDGTVIGAALILSSISVATSPATVIAVIKETDARGRFTDFVLAVTVFKDIIVVLLFSITLSVARPLIMDTASLEFDYVLTVIREMGLSIGVGFAAGGLILLYLKYVDKQRALFLLGFVLLGIEAATMLHIKLVLVFMIAGFFVQNFSNSGGKLIHAIGGSSLPIYVIFFSIAGSALNLPVFLDNWLIALVIVGLRLVTTYHGTYLGGKLTGAPSQINNYGWMGFIGQAGLSLGLAVLVSQTIPGEIGVNIKTLIISTIAINQIIGPVLFRYSLVRVGEAGVVNS